MKTMMGAMLVGLLLFGASYVTTGKALAASSETKAACCGHCQK